MEDGENAQAPQEVELIDDSLVDSLLTESIELTGMDDNDDYLQPSRKADQDQGGFSDDL